MPILLYKFIRNDLINTFTNNYENIITDQILLLRNTILLTNIISSDPIITTIFRAIDSIIYNQRGIYLLRRLAYVQLIRLFISLEAIIKNDKENREIYLEPGQRITNITINIYLYSQEGSSNIRNIRDKLKERKRSGRSQTNLVRPSPLFILIYSDIAKIITYVNIFFYIYFKQY